MIPAVASVVPLRHPRQLQPELSDLVVLDGDAVVCRVAVGAVCAGDEQGVRVYRVGVTSLRVWRTMTRTQRPSGVSGLKERLIAHCFLPKWVALCGPVVQTRMAYMKISLLATAVRRIDVKKPRRLAPRGFFVTRRMSD